MSSSPDSAISSIFICNDTCFPSHHVKRLLRYLETPLETFSVTHCHLLQSHLCHFFQCERLHQLRHLDMSGVQLSSLWIMPLRALLENVADTIKTLELQGCGMKDHQLSELLPAISQRSQLTKVNFYTNDFSMNVFSDLLHHTANLSKMTME